MFTVLFYDTRSRQFMLLLPDPTMPGAKVLALIVQSKRISSLCAGRMITHTILITHPEYSRASLYFVIEILIRETRYYELTL